MPDTRSLRRRLTSARRARDSLTATLAVLPAGIAKLRLPSVTRLRRVRESSVTFFALFSVSLPRQRPFTPTGQRTFTRATPFPVRRTALPEMATFGDAEPTVTDTVAGELAPPSLAESAKLSVPKNPRRGV